MFHRMVESLSNVSVVPHTLPGSKVMAKDGDGLLAQTWLPARDSSMVTMVAAVKESFNFRL